MTEPTRYTRFQDFYPYYLGEHANATSRRLHVVGTSLALGLLLTALATANPWWVGVALLQGYAFAWVGHFFFEHNKPATFRYPLYSLAGDWRMWWEVVTRQRAW